MGSWDFIRLSEGMDSGEILRAWLMVADRLNTQSCHGFKMAPVVGRVLADLVLIGEAKGVELKYFRIRRFQENPGGNVKDYEDQVNSFSNHK
ncbi:hypothetical protein OIU79_011271 [Salix purpurea]|uniref:Uncharacterized protein n=1 Tax=Salix purpurea TaxID=77065 RepID=A0A9Q0T1M6_SALPP|nr:hypothetical protein OIU79_011271 [Salix purpurea]